MGILRDQLNSIHNFNGRDLELRPGALNTSELHAQGTQPTTVTAVASEYDLDGKTPEKYSVNDSQS